MSKEPHEDSELQERGKKTVGCQQSWWSLLPPIKASGAYRFSPTMLMTSWPSGTCILICSFSFTDKHLNLIIKLHAATLISCQIPVVDLLYHLSHWLKKILKGLWILCWPQMLGWTFEVNICPSTVIHNLCCHIPRMLGIPSICLTLSKKGASITVDGETLLQKLWLWSPLH